MCVLITLSSFFPQNNRWNRWADTLIKISDVDSIPIWDDRHPWCDRAGSGRRHWYHWREGRSRHVWRSMCRWYGERRSHTIRHADRW
ncbi:unnamed protein product [Haemonchus placei]|uniref:Uncharacterized protein n=1 Tax=Haemonchus placei TaxID=6290 RepID=A0A3P7WX37_HAEPC|nr:unnamed protein product [Haemonchus placei]